jgi:hypothetical protein
MIGLIGLVMKPMGPYLEYALNQEFIANNYCVNEDKPELKCNGSCYLMQRLKEQAESRQDTNVTIEEVNQNLVVTIPPAFRWSDFYQRISRIALIETALPDAWIKPPIAPPPRYS